MSPYAQTWELVRGRLVKDIAGMSHEQLNWRMHPGSLTIAEMVVHVAGVEVSFISQMLGTESELEGDMIRLKASATDGSVNDKPFPFHPEELTLEKVQWALGVSEKMVRPYIVDPPSELLTKPVVSALGPLIDGAGAFARLAYHPGYHQGQVYLIASSPDFPKA